MSDRWVFLARLSVAVCPGCATQASLSVYAQPPGAYPLPRLVLAEGGNHGGRGSRRASSGIRLPSLLRFAGFAGKCVVVEAYGSPLATSPRLPLPETFPALPRTPVCRIGRSAQIVTGIDATPLGFEDL